MKTSKLLPVSLYFYRAWLWAYPAGFRREFGSDMKMVFQDCCQDALSRQGAIGIWRLWRRTLFDLITTIPREHGAEWQQIRLPRLWHIMMERSRLMPWNRTVVPHPFGERLAQIISREPLYYDLFVTRELTSGMTDVVESLVLEGDPNSPEMTLALFQELGFDLPEVEMESWLSDLRAVALQMNRAMPLGFDNPVTEQLMQRVFADPQLYELVAASEPGYGLLDLIECLALDTDLDGIEEALLLMRHLGEN
jgi:hypothetical protein